MKIKKGYVAMNENDFDLENMSFHNSKRKAQSVWGKSQKIVKVEIHFK